MASVANLSVMLCFMLYFIWYGRPLNGESTREADRTLKQIHGQ